MDRWIDLPMKADVLVPAAILAFILAFLVAVLLRAQSRPDFDVANFLRDEARKESALRAFAFVALGLSSWVIATLTFQGHMTPDYFLYYNLTWANTLAIVKLVDKWNGVLPFSKPGSNGVTGDQAQSSP